MEANIKELVKDPSALKLYLLDKFGMVDEPKTVDFCKEAYKFIMDGDMLQIVGLEAKTGMPVAKRVFCMDMDEKGNVQMHGEIPPYMSIQLKDGVYFVYEDIDGSRRCELFDGKNEKENIQYVAFKFGAVSLKLWGEDLGEYPLTTEKAAEDDSCYITSYAKAACDFNGKRWTELLVERGLSFELPKDDKNEWYIPAIGELYVMYIFKNNINEALKYAKRKPLKDTWYWSSTEYSAAGAWYLNAGYGSFNYSGKTHEIAVRPVSAFDPLSL